MSGVIDTLEIAHELRQAGLAEPQADAIARQFKKRFDADRGELVTRDYLEAALARQSEDLHGSIAGLRTEVHREIGELRSELHREIAGVHSEIGGLRGDMGGLRAEMARIERDLILKLGGIIVLAATVIGALGVLF